MAHRIFTSISHLQASMFANIIGKDSIVFKWSIGAFTLFVINALNKTGVGLNVALGIPGAGLLAVPLISSIWSNLLELLPAQAQPYAQTIAQTVSQDVVSALSPTIDNQATAVVPVVTVPPGPHFSMPTGIQ